MKCLSKKGVRNFHIRIWNFVQGGPEKKSVNIFVRVWMRKKAAGGDNERQEATRKGVGAKNQKNRGYNRRAQKVGTVMGERGRRKEL